MRSHRLRFFPPPPPPRTLAAGREGKEVPTVCRGRRQGSLSVRIPRPPPPLCGSHDADVPGEALPRRRSISPRRSPHLHVPAPQSAQQVRQFGAQRGPRAGRSPLSLPMRMRADHARRPLALRRRIFSASLRITLFFPALNYLPESRAIV